MTEKKKTTYKIKMPYNRKDLKFWVTLEQFKKIDKLCEQRHITKTTLMTRFVDELIRQIELTEEEMAEVEAEKQRRIEAGFYIPRE